MAIHLAEVPVKLEKTIVLVQKVMAVLGEEEVRDGAAALLCGYLILAAPRPLPAEVLLQLMEHGSKELGVRIGKACEGMPLDDPETLKVN